MKVLETILFEYILGYILQGFTLTLGIFAFGLIKFEYKKYLISSIIVVFVTYFTRLLPINFGVHTILDLICSFLLGTLYIKLPALATIRSLLIITIILLFTEIANALLMKLILGQARYNSLMSDPTNTYIVGLPASIIFASLITAVYIVRCLRRKNNDNGACST